MVKRRKNDAASALDIQYKSDYPRGAELTTEKPELSGKPLELVKILNKIK